MRTTVDIPDNVYRRIKAKAALRGETFRLYLVKTLQRDLEISETAPKNRLKGPLFKTQKPLANTSEQLSQILDDEDHARYLADVNFWLALTFEKHPHCRIAWDWLNLQESNSCVVCRMTQQGFLRLATNPKAFSKPLTHKQAWEAYEQLVGDERIDFLDEPAGVEFQWKAFSIGAKHSPKIWNDAYLAAFAINAHTKVLTFNKGFKAYEGLALELLG